MTIAYPYIRFSSPKQEKGDSFERQQSAVLAHCHAKGWEVAEEVADRGKSAWKGDHLASGELGKFAKRVLAGEIPRGSVLCVESLDRLSRQGHYEARRWLEDMTAAGLHIATVASDRLYDHDSLRSNDKVFEIMEILMKAVAANEYVKQLSDRLKSSWKARRKDAAKGVVISKHVPGWLAVDGDCGDPDRKFVPIPDRVNAVVRIYQMAADGLGARAIAAALNVDHTPNFGRGQARHANRENAGWEHTYVGDLLASPAVEGDYIPTVGREKAPAGRKVGKPIMGERIVGYFGEPIVDADLVARARAAVARRKGTGGRGKGSEALHNLFAGLIRCASCNGPMILTGSSQKPARYLVCRDAVRKHGCEMTRTFDYPKFEAAALDAMLPLALDDRYFRRPDQSQAIAIRLAEAEKAVTVKTEEARKIGRMLIEKDSTVLRGMLDDAEAEVDHLKDAVRALQKELQAARGTVAPAEHLRRVMEVREALKHPDIEVRLPARRQVIEAIRGVEAQVSCLRWAEDGKKTIMLDLLGGMVSFLFDNAGQLIGKEDQIRKLWSRVAAMTPEQLAASRAEAAAKVPVPAALHESNRLFFNRWMAQHGVKARV